MVHRISWWDLEFERVPVEFYSIAGVPQIRLEKVGMPRIPQSVVNGVFYLYQTKDDAIAGRDPGGTGFVVQNHGTFQTSSAQRPDAPVYGVTNWHVACDGGYSTIRLNRKGGGVDVVELNPDEWIFKPGKYDVAAVPLEIDSSVHEVSAVSTWDFALDPATRRGEYQGISLGDDVFMVGLFIDHDGGAVNVPSVRFGNISMLPNANAVIEQPTGYRGISYVIDMHSRTGFSGSPVYVYRTFGSDLTEEWGHEIQEIELDSVQPEYRHSSRIRTRGRLRSRNLFKFLGIHWAQFPEIWELGQRSMISERRKKSLVLDGNYVEGMSGMTCVIPAWQIVELLEMKELKKAKAGDVASGSVPSKPRLESVDRAKDVNPQHREDFTALLGEAARTPPQDD